jgi:hypothetical protein
MGEQIADGEDKEDSLAGDNKYYRPTTDIKIKVPPCTKTLFINKIAIFCLTRAVLDRAPRTPARTASNLANIDREGRVPAKFCKGC